MGGTTINMSASASAQIITEPTSGVVSTPTPEPDPDADADPHADPDADPDPGPDGHRDAAPPHRDATCPRPQCFAPTANFSVNPTGGSRYKGPGNPGTIFTLHRLVAEHDGRLQPVWSWSFGDGSGASSQQNPTYVYSLGRTPRRSRSSASNSAGSSSTTRTVTVTN